MAWAAISPLMGKRWYCGSWVNNSFAFHFFIYPSFLSARPSKRILPYIPSSIFSHHLHHSKSGILFLKVLELARNAARDNKKIHIIPRHALLAVSDDEEFGKLLNGVTTAHGGVLHNINAILLPKRMRRQMSKMPKLPSRQRRHEIKWMAKSWVYLFGYSLVCVLLCKWGLGGFIS